VSTCVFAGTLSRSIMLESAGTLACTAGAGAAGAVRTAVPRPGVAGAARVARAGREDAAGAALRCGLIDRAIANGAGEPGRTGADIAGVS
jgi:hypothetical protein